MTVPFSLVGSFALDFSYLFCGVLPSSAKSSSACPGRQGEGGEIHPWLYPGSRRGRGNGDDALGSLECWYRSPVRYTSPSCRPGCRSPQTRRCRIAPQSQPRSHQSPPRVTRVRTQSGVETETEITQNHLSL